MRTAAAFPIRRLLEDGEGQLGWASGLLGRHVLKATLLALGAAEPLDDELAVRVASELAGWLEAQPRAVVEAGVAELSALACAPLPAGGRAFLPTLLAALEATLVDQSDELRRKAALALGALSTDAAAAILRGALFDPAPPVRAAAAAGLAAHGDRAPALRLASRDDDRAVRATALLSLAAAPAKLSAVAAGASAAPDERAQLAALTAQALRGDDRLLRGAALKVARLARLTEAAKAVLPLLHGIEPDERLRAVRCLRALGVQSAADRLAELAEDDPDPAVRTEAALAALALASGAPASPELFLAHEDPAVRAAAVGELPLLAAHEAELAQDDGSAAVAMLLEALGDEDSLVCAAAARALAEVAQEPGAPAGAAPRLSPAALALARVAVEPLAALTADPDAGVRLAAALALAALSPADGEAPLRALLETLEEPRERDEALAALFRVAQRTGR